MDEEMVITPITSDSLETRRNERYRLMLAGHPEEGIGPEAPRRLTWKMRPLKEFQVAETGLEHPARNSFEIGTGIVSATETETEIETGTEITNLPLHRYTRRRPSLDSCRYWRESGVN